MDVITGSISTYVFTIEGHVPRFLALLRAPGLLHAGTWQAVHGMIDAGETAYAAAYREALEETGLRPNRFYKSDFVERFYSEVTDGVHLVPAFASYVDEAPSPVLSEEHTDFSWCTLHEVLARFVWPSQREAVRVIADAVAAWPETAIGLRDITHLVAS